MEKKFSRRKRKPKEKKKYGFKENRVVNCV